MQTPDRQPGKRLGYHSLWQVLAVVLVICVCPSQPDPCSGQPCQNGGTCEAQSSSSFLCHCPSSCVCVNMGELCQHDPSNCSDVDGMATVPDLWDCAGFFMCQCGIKVSSSRCPPGLWYDHSIQGCIRMSVVEDKCAGQSDVTTETSTSADPCLSDPCQNGGVCQPQSDGSFVCDCQNGCPCVDLGVVCEIDVMDCTAVADGNTVPDPDDCAAFHACLNGAIAFSPTCPTGNWYNSSTQSCLGQHIVEPTCSSSTATALATEEKKAVTLSTTEADPCANRPCQNGGTCVTQANDTFVCQCPSSCVCVDMGEFCEYDPFDCSSGNELRSHPDNCQLYIRCVHSFPNILTCANGTIFDPQYASCNFPLLVEPKCETGWSEDTTPVAAASTTVLVTTPIVTSSQPTMSESSVPTQTTTLPATTLFDPCASNPCQNGGTCLPQANDTFTCECPDVCYCVKVGIFCQYEPDPFDCTSPGEYRSHPDDCQLYIRCVNNNPAVLSCGNRMYFDPQINKCNFPYVVVDNCLNDYEYYYYPN